MSWNSGVRGVWSEEGHEELWPPCDGGIPAQTGSTQKSASISGAPFRNRHPSRIVALPLFSPLIRGAPRAKTRHTANRYNSVRERPRISICAGHHDKKCSQRDGKCAVLCGTSVRGDGWLALQGVHLSSGDSWTARPLVFTFGAASCKDLCSQGLLRPYTSKFCRPTVLSLEVRPLTGDLMLNRPLTNYWRPSGTPIIQS